MRLLNIKKQQAFNAELVENHDSSIPGPIVIKRADNAELIAMRDIMGVPHAPGSTLAYQLLEVTPEEKKKLSQAGITITESVNDLRDWLKNWDGPK